MGDILDIDPPDEVIAASARVHAAAGDVRDQVAGAVTVGTRGGPGESALDAYLLGKLNWITGSFGRAVSTHAENSTALHEYTTRTAQDLGRADTDGGGAIANA